MDLLCARIRTRERHNPYLATPGHIRDPILKWCTRPYPPVDVQRLAAPIRTHLEISALSTMGKVVAHLCLNTNYQRIEI